MFSEAWWVPSPQLHITRSLSDSAIRTTHVHSAESFGSVRIHRVMPKLPSCCPTLLPSAPGQQLCSSLQHGRQGRTVPDKPRLARMRHELAAATICGALQFAHSCLLWLEVVWVER